jgi:hypothetical protein
MMTGVMKRTDAMKRAGLVRRLAWLAIVTGWLACPAHGAAAIYQWTTPDGVIGLTDDPGRIPDKYRATAKPYEPPDTAPLSIQPAVEVNQPQPSPPTPADVETEPTMTVDQNGHDRAWWQARVQELKGQRADLVDQQEQTEKKVNEIQYFGRQTAGERQEQFQLNQQIDDLKKQIKAIDQQLTSGLADEARRAGAPQGWVRE